MKTKRKYRAQFSREDMGAGPNKWGVVDAFGCVLYEPLFDKKVAVRLAEMESSKRPPVDWMAARRRLIREGLLQS